MVYEKMIWKIYFKVSYFYNNISVVPKWGKMFLKNKWRKITFVTVRLNKDIEILQMFHRSCEHLVNPKQHEGIFV